MKKAILILLVLLLGACKTDDKTPDNTGETTDNDVVSYNVNYELTYNPIYETGDRFSILILNRDSTFSMTVNSCDGVDLLTGTFFIESDNTALYLVPLDYECDLEVEECDVRGMKFIINNQKELVIVNGTRCIAEESIFQVVE